MTEQKQIQVDPMAALSAATKLNEFYRNEVLVLENQALSLAVQLGHVTAERDALKAASATKPADQD